MRWGSTLLIAILLLPLMWQTMPAMLDTIRSAGELASVPPLERRAVVLGSWTRSSAAIAARLSESECVDIVVIGDRGVEMAPFVAADLFPRPTWCYDGWVGWRAREPMRFIRDVHAVNAARRPPTRCGAVVVVDPHHDPPVWLLEGIAQ